MGPEYTPSTLTIEPVALHPRLLGGGPTAIRTRVTSSASSCDIQATLWVQRVLDRRTRLNPDGASHIERGRMVFQLGSASFFDFGPVIGCGVL